MTTISATTARRRRCLLSLVVLSLSLFVRVSCFQKRCLQSTGCTSRSQQSLTVRQSAPTSADDKLLTDSPSSKLSCVYCSKPFESRNALFRHLREDEVCSNEHLGEEAGNHLSKMVMIKEQVAFLFGYEDLSNASVQTDSGTTVVEQSSKIIQETLLEALQTRLDVPQTVRDEISLSTFTQSSLARLRRRALSQEAGCSAAGDVLVVSVNVPKTMTRKNWKQIFQVMKSRLATLHDQDNNETKVHLYACQLMDNTGAAARFHAERSCTQRVYHYVLPVAWLPEGDKLQEWWQQPDSSSKATSMKRPESNIHSSNFPKKASPPPRSLKKLKDALRSAESAAIPLKKTRCNQNANDDSANVDLQLIKVANGRYGALGCKERRPWHSFASQELAGGAVSPNHETAWRVVDKARIIGFVEDEANDDNNKDDSGGTQKPTQISAIVEVKGDEFLPEQIRRIIGSAVAIAHGWLPDDFFSLSLSSDTVVETPLAPAGRLYLSETRFHFEELKANGLPLFRDHRSRRIVQEWNTSEALEMSNRLQQMILKKKQSTDEMVIESNWFEDLRGITCPRICESFENEVTLAAIATPTSMRVEDVDKAFAPVLSELRRIVAGGEWPETSAARSSVIRGDSDRDGTDGHKMGSFTIVNPLVLSGNEIRAVANAKFPVLVEEVFRLETVLSERQMTRVTLQGLEQNLDVDRPASSHCAVNCNAQFKPHVDSGVGKGQTLSMIVGLGDYTGGELFVEGEKFDISHTPLEFDGFRLRHWTAPFDGERFSLVWFTPEK